jgi:hypothetical protein
VANEGAGQVGSGARAGTVAVRAADLRRAVREALAALGRAREEIDSLNVFPVADADTGTNLYLTVEAAHQALAALPADADLARCLAEVTRSSMVGAWGNSGVILSQMLRGACAVVAAAPEVMTPAQAGELVGLALSRATELAYTAVDRPAEGTMLTVAHSAAGAAVGEDAAAALERAALAAHRALELTPLQLPVLAQAGVVDAGGRGVTVLLDVLVGLVSGVTPMSLAPRARLSRPELPLEQCAAGLTGYELVFLFDGDQGAAARLRADLANCGDSLVVVGGEALWNVHIHTQDCGAALDVAMQSGRPHGIRVTNLFDAADRAATNRADLGRAVVALASGPGLAKLLDEAGAVAVDVAPGAVPATADLLEAMRRPRAGQVVLLPNEEASRAACEAAAVQARAAGIEVAVIPTGASVQSLAALAVHDRGRRFTDDVVAMTAAATATRHAGVLIADQESMTSVGVCRAGDVLGLIEGEVVAIGTDPEAVGAELIERLLGGGGELVTLIAGTGLTPGTAAKLAEDLHRRRPEVECVCHDGGQPDHLLLLGVE